MGFGKSNRRSFDGGRPLPRMTFAEDDSTIIKSY
jgi:hypothetical protein